MRYEINLSAAEVKELKQIIAKGLHSAQTFRAAYVLLNCDESEHSDKIINQEISNVLKIGMRTIDRIKKRYAEGGLDNALERKATTRIYEIKVDEKVKTRLIALCYERVPAGHKKWSLRLLAKVMQERGYVDSISHVKVAQILKEANITLERVIVFKGGCFSFSFLLKVLNTHFQIFLNYFSH